MPLGTSSQGKQSAAAGRQQMGPTVAGDSGKFSVASAVGEGLLLIRQLDQLVAIACGDRD
jgi:hypothetical protein